MSLRYLQTLAEVAVEKNSTILFPIPIEFMKAFMNDHPDANRGRPELPGHDATPPTTH
jgi:hypothetical protein